MTELSFLLDLLLNEKLSKTVKEKLAARIRIVESSRDPDMAKISHLPIPGALAMIGGAPQSPSTVAAMQRQMQENGGLVSPHPNTAQDIPTERIIAATPQTAAALQHREDAIKQGMSGKPEPGRTSPRKF